jgi:hypothetical protein
MIIIEGIDGSGKSMLAKRLSIDLGIKKHHFGAPPDALPEFNRRCNRSAILFSHAIIQDRTPFISEAIYGHLRPEGPFLEWKKSQEVIRQSNPHLIYCRPANHFMPTQKKYDDPKQQVKIKTHWTTLLSLYDVYMVQVAATRYDWTSSIESILYQKVLAGCEAKIRQAGF